MWIVTSLHKHVPTDGGLLRVLILFVSRAWDAVTDPLIGYLVSRSKRTPIGKLIPWLVWLDPRRFTCTSFWVELGFISGCCTHQSHQCSSHRLLVSSPLAVLSYVLLWFEPGGAVSQPLSVLWFLTVTCLFETLMSVSVAGAGSRWSKVIKYIYSSTVFLYMNVSFLCYTATHKGLL